MKCDSCGAKSTDHLGLIGTCPELKHAESRIKELRSIIYNEGKKWAEHHTDPLKKAYWEAFTMNAG